VLCAALLGQCRGGGLRGSGVRLIGTEELAEVLDEGNSDDNGRACEANKEEGGNDAQKDYA